MDARDATGASPHERTDAPRCSVHGRTKIKIATHDVPAYICPDCRRGL